MASQVTHKSNQFVDTVFGGKWNLFEYLLLGTNVVTTIALLIYGCVTDGVDQGTIGVAFIANITNIVSVILATKKKVFCFVGGLVAVILLGAVSFKTGNVGNCILYGVIYIPSQIVAFFIGRKNSKNKIDVTPRHMLWWGGIILAISIIGMSALFTWIDQLPGFQKFGYKGSIPPHELYQYILDATILVGSLAMTVLAILRFSERWVLSIVVDCCSIALWASEQQGIIMTSCICMLIAAIYGLIKGRK